jgi:anthranilate phosphoribosyltransferase
LAKATLEDLAGGDAETNADIIRAILNGEDQGPKREAVLLNAGAALFVAGAADSISAGFDLAAVVIDDGRAAAKLADLAAN